MDASPPATSQGPRARVTLLPIATRGAMMDRYLGYVAPSTTRLDAGQAYLLDGNEDVLASSSPTAALGKPLGDRGLATGSRTMRDRGSTRGRRSSRSRR